jgi:hypothetical protein
MKRRNNFLEQLERKQEAAKPQEPAQGADNPIDEMSLEELRWVALEKPVNEMSYEELQWVSSGEATRRLTVEERSKAKMHNFNDLKRTRRRVWK